MSELRDKSVDEILNLIEQDDDKQSVDLPFGLDKVVDTVVDTAVGAKKAFTGEDKEIEFENAGEITDIDIGFFEQLAPMLKMMVSRTDTGKAGLTRLYGCGCCDGNRPPGP